MRLILLMETDTKPSLEKCCSKCDQIKTNDNFLQNKKVCKDCRNKKSRENYNASKLSDKCGNHTCNACNQSKLLSSFVRLRNTCRDCDNANRRKKYQTDESFRLISIQKAVKNKQDKSKERRRLKLEEIGENNKKCSICSSIKDKCKFRYNRLKCRDCERDDPSEKFKRVVRSRIWAALSTKKLHTIEYLGLTNADYLQWILAYNEKYTIDNRGKEWHIDHVIPLSKFNLDDEEEQLIAFNWRNTMPLSVKENLSKNNKIIQSQIERHLNHLLEYHKQNNIELPQKFINLFARYLVAGSPLEPLLPLNYRKICEDLG